MNASRIKPSLCARRGRAILTPFQTETGLGASGAKVYYKVFVVLTTGRERGSKAVSVVRP